MILNQKEKENLVTDLLNKGHTVKQISKQAHVSFSDIAKIKRKVTGEEAIEKTKETKKSLTAQSFELLLEGKSPIEVAVILDLRTEEVLRIFNDFLLLQNMHKVVRILKEYRYNLAPFLKLFHYLKKNSTKTEDIKHAMDNINDINALKQQKEYLKEEVESLKEEIIYLQDNLGDLKRDCY